MPLYKLNSSCFLFQGIALDMCHIVGLSAILVHLASFPNLLVGVSCQTEESKGHFIDLLLDSLPKSSSQHMHFSIRWELHISVFCNKLKLPSRFAASFFCIFHNKLHNMKYWSF